MLGLLRTLYLCILYKKTHILWSGWPWRGGSTLMVSLTIKYAFLTGSVTNIILLILDINSFLLVVQGYCALWDFCPGDHYLFVWTQNSEVFTWNPVCSSTKGQVFKWTSSTEEVQKITKKIKKIFPSISIDESIGLFLQ